MSNQHQQARPIPAKINKEAADRIKEKARQSQAAAIQDQKQVRRARKMASKLMPRLAKAIATTADITARCKKAKLEEEHAFGATVVKSLRAAQADMNKAVAGRLNSSVASYVIDGCILGLEFANIRNYIV